MKDLNLEKTYNPAEIERDLYRQWEESGAFTAHRQAGKKPFCIVMPPPNITGQLHMGHAMDCVLQDSLTRYHRMKGDPTLWLPGTDHASIATEVKIVEQMAREGIRKEDITREQFLDKAWAWKKEYGGRITRQLRRMGASCDWSRERFTMDEGCSKAVREVFVRLYEKGLIYRGNRIINWCPVCKTALSDAEVEFEEQPSHLWYIHYPAADGGEGVVVATTRPETMLGDTGVAVNPSDERYTALVGKQVILPLLNKPIPVVADAYVEKEFGTGAVKMTPAHDPNDFEVGLRHNLPCIRVINDDGTMNENAGPYQGMTAMACRQAIVEDLQKGNYLVKIEDYRHNVGTCYRCHNTVEPLVSTQWFVKMASLAAPAIQAVREGKTAFIPDRFSKTYFNWMENIRDWCISRQLWWGHRIPAWYCDQCGKMSVSREDLCACPSCGSKRIRQDEDVLDTWFSSALWPFSTLGWPDETEDLKYFYPTSTLVTGYDIIFFWVARMIFSGIEQMGEVPFSKVLIHGLVRDEKGRKMSKSLGNGIDPLEVIDQYGADALRFSLCMGISPGNDTRYSTAKMESARNFANKIWNASRFVLMNLDGFESLEGKTISLADQWILTRYRQCVQAVTEYFENMDFGLAAQKLYDFIWSEFCDWYIEMVKPALTGEDQNQRAAAQAVLIEVLQGTLKMIHPFMPFISEKLFCLIPGHENESCMLSSWPCAASIPMYEKEAEQMDGLMETIRAIRNLRAEMNVQPSHKARLLLRVNQDAWKPIFADNTVLLQRLAGVSTVHFLNEDEKQSEKMVSAVTAATELFIPLGDLVDIDKEIARLEKERLALEKEIQRSEGKLNNPGFLGKAPAALVEAERSKLEDNRTRFAALENRIHSLKA